jgi:hypothetical protein
MQLDVMRTWFFANYEDPAESTPYESAEGGYQYIWGGPYEPEEELQDEFGGLVPDKVIEELANELRDISWQWTGHPEHDNDYFFDSILQTTEHHKTFEASLLKIEPLLKLKIPKQDKNPLLRLLFINVITCIETYLSDLFISTVGKDQTLLRRFVESTPEFKSEKVAMSDVFKVVAEMEKRTQSYLLDLVWHNLGRVKPMFKDTLNIQFPENVKNLFKAVVVRHDLVHRNGKTKDGSEHNIDIEAVNTLLADARSFVSAIDEQLSESHSISVNDF